MINQGALKQISSQIKEDEIIKDPKRKQEMIKIILQTLENLGYDNTVKNLEEESSVKLYSQDFQQFKEFVMNGQFDDALKFVENINLTPQNLKLAQFFIFKQKYLELLLKNDINEALLILRKSIINLAEKDELNNLSTLLIYSKQPDVLKQMVNWKDQKHARRELVKQIQNNCSPPNTMESNYMEKIVKESLLFQILKCPGHIQENIEYSLIEDHVCKQDQIPDKCIQILGRGNHDDEIWMVKFSNSGTKMVSISKNLMMIIWSFDLNTLEATKKLTIKKIHKRDVFSVSWSPNDKKILTTSADQTVGLWSSEKGTLLKSLQGHQDIVCCALYHPINQKIYTGGIDSQVIIWDKMGTKEDFFMTNRISDMIFTSDGKYLIILCASFQKLLFIDVETKSVAKTIEEQDKIISISLSKDDKLLLVNTSYSNPELHLYNMENKEIINYFDGYVQDKFLVKCLIGGHNNSYVACGSEDGKLHVWHQLNNKKANIVQAHKLPINFLSFNPALPNIIATASDDESIRIWAPSQLASDRNKQTANSDNEDDFSQDQIQHHVDILENIEEEDENQQQYMEQDDDDEDDEDDEDLQEGDDDDENEQIDFDENQQQEEGHNTD